MTVTVNLRCDAHRDQRPCLTQLPLPALNIRDARRHAATLGWTAPRAGGRTLDTCPSCTERAREWTP